MAIDKSLKFKDIYKDVKDNSWRKKKSASKFMLASWDFLLSTTPNRFFVKWLTNEGKKNTTANYQETQRLFGVFFMFKTFLKLKKKVLPLERDVYIYGHQCYPQALVMKHHWLYLIRELGLAIINFQILPRPHAGSGNNLPCLPLLNYLLHHLKLTINTPNVWLWIVSSQFDLDTAKRFASLRLKDFKMKILTYYHSKAKRLDNSSNRALASMVRLIFLLKKDEDGEPKHLNAWKKSYSTTSS